MHDELVKRLRAQADAERYFVGEDMLYDKAADAIEELSKQNEKWEEVVKIALDFIPRWTPVTERLPEIGQRVLVVGMHGKAMYTGIYNGGGAWRGNGKPKPNRIITGEHGWRTFTHWMPLPKSPKEE